MNLIKIFIWFFVIFLNYAIFQANFVVGIVILLVEIAIYSRIKGGGGGGRTPRGRFRSQRFINQKITVDTSNATLLVLELMKMEQKAREHESRYELNEVVYHSEEHKRLRKKFER
jgi:hypothetical protein